MVKERLRHELPRIVVALGGHRDPIRNEERGVEANAKLSDQAAVGEHPQQQVGVKEPGVKLSDLPHGQVVLPWEPWSDTLRLWLFHRPDQPRFRDARNSDAVTRE